jgi:DNA-binding XRE family transcriptional regulator
LVSGFDELHREIEQEAQADGPQAVAELRALERYYGLWAELIELRRRRAMTQAQLARASGIPQSEISRIERGGANPTLATLQALVDALSGELHEIDRQPRLA